MESSDILALRIDDIGACSKFYDRDPVIDLTWDRGIRFSMNGVIRKLLPTQKWGPYREMESKEWQEIYLLLQRFQAKLTVAITAMWPESEEQLIPFPEKFTDEAEILKEGVQEGLLEIANHGLTHAVITENRFKPQFFTSTRLYHREFYSWIPLKIQEQHIRDSQQILQHYFRTKIVTFVPPGNIYTPNTLTIAKRYGLQYISCKRPLQKDPVLIVIKEKYVCSLHDRDLVLKGIGWFENLLRANSHKHFHFIKELTEITVK